VKAGPGEAAALKPKKLSYKEQRELAALPEKIGELEALQAQLQAAIGDPGFYQQPHEQVNEIVERLQAVEEELTDCFARWEVLESGVDS
jgi:ATP-binding cassette subfamily F protein uup